MADIADARRELATGNLLRALEIVDEIMARGDTSPEFAVVQALVLAKSGQPEIALEQLSRFVRNNPGAVSPRLQLAQMLFSQGKLSDTEREAQEILQRDPASLGALALLAQVFDEPRRAQEHTEVLIRLTRHADCNGKLFRDSVLILAARQRWYDVAMATEHLECGTESEKLLTIRSHALCELQQLDEAVACLRLLIATHGRDIRHIVSEVLSAGKPLIAARLLTTTDERHLVFDDQIREARQTVDTYCRKLLAGITADQCPLQFAECVRTLLELMPKKTDLHKANARVCALLLRQARDCYRENDAAAALSMLRHAVDTTYCDDRTRTLCIDLFLECGDVRGAILALIPLVGENNSAMHRLLALLTKISNWAGLDEALVVVRERCDGRVDCARELQMAAHAVVLDLWARLDVEDASRLLDQASALVALSGASERNGEVIEAVLKRSRRAIRKAGYGDRPRLSRLFEKHLVLAPSDRDIRRKLVKLRLKSAQYLDGRALVTAELERDPHHEGSWNDLALCNDALFLRGEAKYARDRAQLLAAVEL